MAQGIPRDKEQTIEALRPYYQLGCSTFKACAYAGIPLSTVQTWIDADDDLRCKIVAWQNEMAAKARMNWREQVANKNYEASKQWLERKEKDEFSQRTEQTGADGVPLTINVVSYADKKED